MRKIIGAIVLIVLPGLLAGCINTIDSRLPFQQLEQISLVSEYELKASPAHPEFSLPMPPAPAGAPLPILGVTTDFAWVLTVYDNHLGWLPSFFSGINIGRLEPPLVIEPLDNSCTRYLGATLSPNELWISPAGGSVILEGSIYRPQAGSGFDQAKLNAVVTGGGKIVAADYVHLVLTPSSNVVLFAYSIEDMRQGSRIHFEIENEGREPIYFQATFYADNCRSRWGNSAYTSQLPVGQVKQSLPATPTTVAPRTFAPTTTPTPVVIRPPAQISIPVPSGAQPGSGSTLLHNLSGLAAISASSTLPSDRWGDYFPHLAVDGQRETAWVEGVSGPGIGHWLLLTFPSPITIDHLKVDVGYDSSESIFYANNRIREATLSFSDGSEFRLAFGDWRGLQTVLLPESFSLKTTSSIRFRIESVYPGSRYNDTPLAEIQVWGRSEQTVLNQNLSPQARVRASSTLPADQWGSYEPRFAIDSSRSTSWVEGAQGAGVGEWLLLTFPQPIAVEYIDFSIGYDSSDTIFRANNRIKRVTIVFSDGTRLPARFADRRGLQRVSLLNTLNQRIETSSLQIVIEEVYPGLRYDDTPLAEIEVWGTRSN